MSDVPVEQFLWDGVLVQIYNRDDGQGWPFRWVVWPDNNPRLWCYSATGDSHISRSLPAARRDARRRISKLPHRTPSGPRVASGLAAVFFSLLAVGLDSFELATDAPDRWFLIFCVSLAVSALLVTSTTWLVRRRLWMRARRTEWQSPDVAMLASLETVDHGLTGWKRAALMVVDGTVRFGPAAISLPYTADATAQCGRYANHTAPARDCACGFHAARDRAKLPDLAGMYTSTVCDLEVELSGHFIQYEHGWRAARQQVVSVRVDSVCVFCSAPADGLAKVHEPNALHPICRPCSLRGKPGALWSLPELAEQLGVHDIRWADRPALTERNDHS